ncbi:MAG: calcium-binding protein [Nostoc sp. DedQUE12a]|nr:calcium-binding protein [Nostoc sp. DedQUE12a]
MSIIIGTLKSDFLLGTDGNDQIFGLIGNDNISAGLGNDLIYGGLGNDKLAGDGGNDTFKGSRGNDSIDGGDGLDTADYSDLDKTITLSGVGTVEKAGGFGKDQLLKVETVIADASVANNTIDASQSVAGVSITADLQAESISANNVPNLGTLTFKVVNFDNLTGTNESDSIAGDSQKNQLFGNDSNDSIDGRGGNDLITGGLGNDILRGGLGADKFIFNSLKDGLDTIKDYNFGQTDIIEVSKVGFGTNNINDFSYNAGSGSLSFLGQQFAFLDNLSSNVSIKLV